MNVPKYSTSRKLNSLKHLTKYMKNLVKLYCLSIKYLTNKYRSRHKAQDILTTNIIDSTSGTLCKQGGSPYISVTTSGLNEASFDDLEYLYFHHKLMQDKWHHYIYV